MKSFTRLLKEERNSMSTFAVVKDDVVTDLIVADTLEIAEEVSRASCIEVTEEQPLGIGWVHDSVTDTWVGKSPFPSWTLVNGTWQAPTSMPNDDKAYVWNEATTSWVEIPRP
jgi:hypothetical protein